MDKRYLVFGITNYYPLGGLSDKEDSYDTLEEALEHVKKDKSKNHQYNDYFQIYDRIECREIKF